MTIYFYIMSENFYNVEKCYDKISEMVITLSTEFSYDTIMCAMEKVMDKGFNITSVSREDLESRGFDTTNITDAQMEELARKMCDDYLEQMFWISLDIIAEDIMGFKKK